MANLGLFHSLSGSSEIHASGPEFPGGVGEGVGGAHRGLLTAEDLRDYL